ncbi:MAG TPA: fasciclin domain-containing protein, partial [Gemmatimonadaceae bacterium]|nr:fasciclin domain-containing protein [Gemmatimonadaceae bacterium]
DLDADLAALHRGGKVGIKVVDGKVMLNGGTTVTATDIKASNGVIHVIDTVLMPPASMEGMKH